MNWFVFIWPQVNWGIQYKIIHELFRLKNKPKLNFYFLWVGLLVTLVLLVKEKKNFPQKFYCLINMKIGFYFQTLSSNLKRPFTMTDGQFRIGRAQASRRSLDSFQFREIHLRKISYFIIYCVGLSRNVIMWVLMELEVNVPGNISFKTAGATSTIILLEWRQPASVFWYILSTIIFLKLLSPWKVKINVIKSK